MFGDSGFRIEDAIVYWDHTTESLWDQWTATAFRGELAGVRLIRISARTMHWPDWVVEHPQTLVLDTPPRA